MQTTISRPATFSGTGLHSGQEVCVRIRPAPADTGILLRRTDPAGMGAVIPARWTNVVDSRLCTRLENGEGIGVSTVEHLMAALAGCGIQNALVDIDGPELPILDGSAAPFVHGILSAGRRHLDAELRAIRVLEPIEVRSGDAMARLEPAQALEIAFSIDFVDAAIGQQGLHLHMANGTFVHELSDSRTFCRLRDVTEMQSAGLALGGTLENAVVIEGDRVLSPGGLRHADEPVRHKMLDALGDLALAGAPLLARYVGLRAGHALTAELLRALFARPDAWALEVLDDAALDSLPGAGLEAEAVMPLRATA